MIRIYIEYDFNKVIDIDKKWIKKICRKILIDKNHTSGTITIIFSNDVTLNEMKKKYFHENSLTDVIAFNLEEENEPIEGEIYISIDRVTENALTFKQDFTMELQRIIIHGCLHIIGYNENERLNKYVK